MPVEVANVIALNKARQEQEPEDRDRQSLKLQSNLNSNLNEERAMVKAKLGIFPPKSQGYEITSEV